jgi:tetratricopeptide (TPR) repeat protein
MARKRRGGGLVDDDTVVDRLAATLERHPPGLHELGPPAAWVPPGWPQALTSVYLAFDGARLFNEAIILASAGEVVRGDDGRWRIGEAGGDEIRVDTRGQVWRVDAETEELVLDGTSVDRWLHGAVDAEAMLYDGDGEFADDVFDNRGEVVEHIAVAQVRAQVRRDGRAIGPRWRLARLLAARGDVAPAREMLEELVGQDATLAWAWLDLARLSEQIGELDGAIDEAVAAAEARPGHEQAGFFWAQAARLAAKAGREPRRAELAARALAIDPDAVRGELAGAEDNLAAGDLGSARGLVELVRALAPRDLAVLDLLRRIEAAEAVAREAAAAAPPPADQDDELDDPDRDDEEDFDEDVGDRD